MIVEMRTYLLKPGTVAAFEERFAEGLPRGSNSPSWEASGTQRWGR